MASDDLRARITEALNTTPTKLLAGHPESLAFHADQLTWDMISARHDRHTYMATCALCRGEADTLADAVMAVVAPEPDGEHPDRCPRCWCGDCGGRLDEHIEDSCTCHSCAISPGHECSLREFLPDAGIGYIAEQLGPLLSTHLGPKQQQRCVAVAHAANHALRDYDQRTENQR